MVEAGKTSEPHLSPEWQEAIRQEIRDALDNFELFGVVNVSPLSISGGKDERTFFDLSGEEQDFIKGVLFGEIGFDPQTAESIASYKTQAPEGAGWQGEADVRVYRTGRGGEGVFLHEIHYPDKKIDCIIAPSDFQL